MQSTKHARSCGECCSAECDREHEARLDIEQPIGAGEAITITNSFIGNEIVPSRKILKEVPLADLRVVLRPFFISYANGVGQEIKYSEVPRE